jgi:hypothetical protein
VKSGSSGSRSFWWIKQTEQGFPGYGVQLDQTEVRVAARCVYTLQILREKQDPISNGKVIPHKYLDNFSLFQYVLDIDVFPDNLGAGTKVVIVIRHLIDNGLAVFSMFCLKVSRNFCN